MAKSDALLFVDRLGWLEAGGAGERIIGTLGRNVPLRSVVGDLDRDPTTDHYSRKDDQKVSLRYLKHDRPSSRDFRRVRHAPMIPPVDPEEKPLHLAALARGGHYR
jgi:hypothetical protein